MTRVSHADQRPRKPLYAMRYMTQESPHPEALENFEKAYIPEAKIRHWALRNPGRSRVFRTLGFSEEAGNWEALRDAMLEGLPRYPAVFDKQNQYGVIHEVTIPISGPAGKEAPVKTYWIRLSRSLGEA